MGIATGMGNPVKLDKAMTDNKTGEQCAQTLVDIDFFADLPVELLL